MRCRYSWKHPANVIEVQFPRCTETCCIAMKYSVGGIQTRTVPSFPRLLPFTCLISRLNVDCSQARSSRLHQIEAVALTTPFESHCSINDARWKILPSLFPPRRGNFISWSPGGGCYLPPIFDQPPPARSSRYRSRDTTLETAQILAHMWAHVGQRRNVTWGRLFTKVPRYMYANGRHAGRNLSCSKIMRGPRQIFGEIEQTRQSLVAHTKITRGNCKKQEGGEGRFVHSLEPIKLIQIDWKLRQVEVF